MNQASADFPPEVDEFEVAGFTKVPSVKVKPWRALECPIALECQLFQIVEHGEGPYHANYVIGQVVYLHIAEAVMEGKYVDAAKLDAIARLGGPNYTRVTRESIFGMPRPASPPSIAGCQCRRRLRSSVTAPRGAPLPPRGDVGRGRPLDALHDVREPNQPLQALGQFRVGNTERDPDPSPGLGKDGVVGGARRGHLADREPVRAKVGRERES